MNDDNLAFVEHRRGEIARAREKQMEYIEFGFAEVIRKLEEKKEKLKQDFAARYDEEERKFDDKLKILEVYTRD